MGRLQEIEDRLVQINESVFQELCDQFLSIRNKNVSAFSRIGSQIGKQKTVLGTPDSAFLLPNGRYIFVEHSTNVTKGVKKLEEDVLKCLNSEKTGIPREQIAEIIICINFRLSLEDLDKLRQLTIRTRIVLTVYALDELAIELHLNHRDLVHQYLGLSLDTGQVVSIDKFILDYNNAGNKLATPLDNTFLHREKELNALISDLETKDLLILTGPPGVGKTKLALEGINAFTAKYAKFKAFCISYKHHTLLEDLNQYFDNNDEFVLFVDDANRIDVFEQIIGFFRSIKNHRVKLVITVRDYAYSEISLRCAEYSLVRIDVPKLTDQQIIDIIKAEPFGITNSDYYDVIVTIADGNPRIAIMTALLAKAHQNLNALRDVSDLFDTYFATFVLDKTELNVDVNIRCLGIISFFYTLPYKERSVVEPILKNFNVNFNDFIEVIDKLDRLEIVEVQYEHVKIPEQNLATYFFYRAFIKEDLLSFEVLLANYFENNARRFRDTVIPSNNTFGAVKVMDKLQPHLKKYLQKVKGEEETAYKFLETFYFYLQEDTLSFAYEKIMALPQVEQTYNIQESKNNIFHDKDKLVDLLSDFFYLGESIQNAIEMLFEYTRRVPLAINDLLHEIREHLIYDREDFQYGLFRQKILFGILDKGIKKRDKLCEAVFYEIAPIFLGFHFHKSRGGRKNEIYMYEIFLPDEEFVREFRKNIWQILNDSYSNDPISSLNTLNLYSTKFDVTVGLMSYEAPLVISIIETHLHSTSFVDCEFVQTMVRRWKNHNIETDKCDELSMIFVNSTYEVFLKIDWNRYRDKEMYDFDDYKEYEALKEAEIRSLFKFKSKEEILEFFDTFVYLRKLAKDNWNYNNTLDIVIDENFKADFDLGCLFLKTVIESGNEIGYIPRRVFANHLKEKYKADTLWKLITAKKFSGAEDWELAFYDFVAVDLITVDLADSILNTMKQLQSTHLIHFERLKRFLDVKPDLFQELLRVMVSKNRDEKVQLRAWMSFYDEYFNFLGNDLELIEEAYLQQIKADHFDYDGKGFQSILEKDKGFLLKYLQDHYSDFRRTHRSNLKRLGFVWNVPDIEETLEKALDFIVTKDTSLGILEHFSNSFFIDLLDQKKTRARDFILNYVRKNYQSREKMNMIVDISRHTMREFFDDILLLFISLTQDVDLFSKILWRGNGASGVGDVILADIEAADWRNILGTVNKSEVGLSLYPIKKCLNDKIDACIEQGKWERKQRFLERY